jgi:hypothetical protein
MSGRTRLVAMATAVVLGYLPASAQEQEGRVFDTGNDLWSHCSGKGATRPSRSVRQALPPTH